MKNKKEIYYLKAAGDSLQLKISPNVLNSKFECPAYKVVKFDILWDHPPVASDVPTNGH